ncbi:MAG: hypothetical protein AAGF75_14255, partial [Cyanobacteria bacterium P01_H01_bin.130]
MAPRPSIPPSSNPQPSVKMMDMSQASSSAADAVSPSSPPQDSVPSPVIPPALTDDPAAEAMAEEMAEDTVAPQEAAMFTGTTALASIGAELAFVQDASGQYWDFYWRDAEHHNLGEAKLSGCALAESAFAPAAILEYLDRLQVVLTHGHPQRFECVMQIQTTPEELPLSKAFELVMSPVLTAEVHTRQVMVMGRGLLDATTGPITTLQQVERPVVSEAGLEAHQRLLSRIARSIRRTLPLSSALYQILLTKISRQIRRTLNLKDIWQQTVEGLGQAMSVSRCVVWSPEVESDAGV